MKEVNVSGARDAGETTNEVTNEDYLWLGPKDDLNAVLILDGTSGTSGDFGADGKKTGGRVYVETIGKSVEEQLRRSPDKELDKIMKKSIEEAWDAFQEKGKQARDKYFNGESSQFPNSTTVPGAVGSLVRWSEEEVEVLHIGDVETYVVKKSKDVDLFSNKVHQRFDDIMNEKITELRKKGVENPAKSPEVRKLVNSHRSASNFPGAYPQIMFNPLAVEKQGEKESYRRENIEKIILGTDGATTRMKTLFDLNTKGLIDFIEEKDVETAVDQLRKEEDSHTLDELKNSDDAALAVIKF